MLLIPPYVVNFLLLWEENLGLVNFYAVLVYITQVFYNLNFQVEACRQIYL